MSAGAPGSGRDEGGRCPDTYPSLATDTMDFSGLSLIKLKKQEMETQAGAHAHPQLARVCPRPRAGGLPGEGPWDLLSAMWAAGPSPRAGEDAGG